jgi:O-antigen/teichoic acid export membrane protein
VVFEQLMISKIKSLQNHQGFMKYFKNTSWLFAEKILRMVVGLFVGIWVARYLGPEQFGLFSYVQSFVGLFTAIATLGLDGIVVRELVKDESRRDELIGTAFWLKLIGAFVVLVILAIAVNFTSNDQYTNMLVFIIASATIFQSFNVIDFYFQSKVLSKYVVYANVISLLLSSIVKIALILNDASLIAFAWVVLFDSFVLAIGFIYFYFKTNSTFKIKNSTFKSETAASLLKESWPLIFSTMLVTIYMRVDQVMIKEMLDSEAVGYYAAAFRLTSALFIIPTVIASSLFPSIVNAKKISEDLYNSRIQKLYTFLLWFSLIVAFSIFLLSQNIVDLLYGQEFFMAGAVLSVLIWNFVFISLSSVHGNWLTVEGLLKYSMIYSALGLTTNIIANYFFIKEYGVVGAAYATLLSQFVPYLVAFFNKSLAYNVLMIFKGFYFKMFK